MKKIILSIVLIAGTISTTYADGYNRIAVSYDHTALSHNKEASILQIKEEKMGLNGWGINYIHGFGVVGNLFVETGASLDFLWGSKKIDESDNIDYFGHCKLKADNIHLQVPVNLAYRINLSRNVSISPYAGIDFKYNISGKYKGEYDYRIRTDEDPHWNNDYQSTSPSQAYANDHLRGGIEYNWERFQMGWHVGIGCNYRHGYVGVQFGTDFIHPYDIKSNGFHGHNNRITDTNLKISVGYNL